MANEKKKWAAGKNPAACVTNVPRTDRKILQAAINQVGSKKRMSRLIDEIQRGGHEWGKAGAKLTRPFDLRELGYRLVSGRVRLPFGMSLMEVVDADTGEPASFSYVHQEAAMGGGFAFGFVIARSFEAMMNGSENQ